MTLDELIALSPEPSPRVTTGPRASGRWRRIRRAGRPVLGLVVLVVLGSLTSMAWNMVRTQRRIDCKAHLTEVGLAFHRYQEARDRFPTPAITDASGRPLLSWRVAILPYLKGGEALYREFHLDEPWDSPRNLPLVARMPAVFACPSDPGRKAGRTPYRVIVTKTERESDNPMFQEGRGVEMLEVTDGSSNTMLVVESPDSVPWTKPDDLRFDPDLPPPLFGSRHPGGFHALLVDGDVRFLKFTIDRLVLRTIITRDGGEVISA